MSEATLDQRLGTMLRMHEDAGLPEEILYDRMKTMWLETDERSEIVWHPVFWTSPATGDSLRGCTGPYRAQTRRKVDSSQCHLLNSRLKITPALRVIPHRTLRVCQAAQQ
jgi:transposase